MPESTTQPTLIFIPDISGFTQFVKRTEITHSQHIIEEVLEILIDANEIGLEVSEIEGDAILFYRIGAAPTASELLGQVRRMFVDFHAYLKRYEVLRICQCGACQSAATLKLKFVAHFGDIAMKQVKEYSKLFGEDVIAAHRLLKNRVPLDEYALFTNSVTHASPTWAETPEAPWSTPIPGVEDYDVGTIEYGYFPLEPLHREVPEPTIEDYSLPGVTARILEHERDIEAPLELAFNVLSDLSVRHEWLPQLVDVEDLNHRIAQGGSAHRCVIKGTPKDPKFVAHDFTYRDDLISFCETNQRDGVTIVYTLGRIGDDVTRIQIHYLIVKNPIKEFFFRVFMHKGFMREAEENLDSFNAYCKAIVDAETVHSAEIVLTQEPSN